MKVIFLDIDGVLNNQKFFLEKAQDMVALDKIKINYLKKIVDVTNSQIVLTSTWRLLSPSHPDAIALNSYFEAEGLHIYDKTPMLETGRGTEIQKWLYEHPTVTNFVIIDDDDFDLTEFSSRLVKTTWEGDGGLLPSHVLKAIAILQGGEHRDEPSTTSPI